MALRAANQEDSVTIANICCLHVLKQNAVVGRGSTIKSSGICLVYGRIAVVVLVVVAIDREWVLHLGHGEVGELPVLLATATQRTVTVDTRLHADTSSCAIHGDVVEPYMLDVFGETTDRSTMSCTKVAVPNMDVLCIIVANYVIITCTDVAVIDVHVVSPDRDTICVMRRLFSLGFRRRVIDGYIMNGTMVRTIAVTQGDVDTRSILNLEIANQESAAFLESDHGSRIESLLVVASLPPAGSLSIDNRSFTFALYNDVALVLVLTTDKERFVVWCLTIFNEFQSRSCAKVEYSL